MNTIDNLKYERNLYKKGYKLIAGVDEVGRGPLVGPVVASAVILPKNFYHKDIRNQFLLRYSYLKCMRYQK